MTGSRTQRITAKDIAAGRIRIPHDTKRLFPTHRTDIHVDLLGHHLDCRWNPKYGPDQERSGVIGIGRQTVAGVIEPDEVLFVFKAADGVQIRRDSEPSQTRQGDTLSTRSHHRPTPSVATAVSSPKAYDNWRQRRDDAAQKYRPEPTRLLLVAEAPPSALDRYFYFPDVSTQDSLFRYVVRLVLGVEPDRSNKPRHLAGLQAAGVFLIDLCLEPISRPNDLRGCVPDLVRRAISLQPEHIIVIKTRVYDEASHAMRQAGLPVVDARLPFPGSGQQLRFEVEMQAALDKIGWVRPGNAFP